MCACDLRLELAGEEPEGREGTGAPLRKAQSQQGEDGQQNVWGPTSSNLWQGSGPNPEIECSRKETYQKKKKEKGLISLRLRY